MTTSIYKRWLIVNRPDEVPFVKRPEQSHEGVIAMLEEMESLPEYRDATITLVELTWDNQLWVSSGREVLAMHRMAA